MAAVSNAIVLVESLTGNTWKAGEKIAAHLQHAGWGVTSVCSVRQPELGALEAADLVLLGSWTDGLFVIGQRPGGRGHLSHLPVMRGKRAAAFCTYALNPGRVPAKMTQLLSQLGADASLGALALHRRKLDQHSEEFVARLLANLAATPLPADT
jgi:hypothetical protein